MPDTPLTGRIRPVPADLFGGRLKDCRLLDLEVSAITDLSPTLRSIRFVSPDLIAFEWQAGQDVMFDVPGTEPPLRRRYTIRRADPAEGTLDIEVVLHGEGPFARWAAGVTVGDHIDGIGPRGVVPLRDALHHIFVADESALPVTFAYVEAMPASATATAVLATETGEAVVAPEGLDATWTTFAELAAVLAQIALPDGSVAYVNGERSLVRGAVDVLTARGMATESIASQAYWRRDQANAGHGEPARD